MKTIQKAAVLGAGNMGSGIAQKIATEGIPVVLVDLTQELADKGRERIRTLLAEGVERRLFNAGKADEILARVTAVGGFGEGLADVDLVIEAVFEDKDVKKDVFGKVSAAVRADTILATNTSSFRVSDLASAVKGPERFLGLHYFYHPAKNRLVEVVPGDQTDPAAFTAAWRAQEVIGKTPIRSADAPGFIVNRYFVPWLNEAVRILEEGAATIPTVEAAAKAAFSIGMGPFELMNVTGVPIALHAATTLGEELGPFYAPAPLLAKQVESGELWSLDGDAAPASPGGSEASDADAAKAVADRLLAVVFLVAAQMVDDGVCSREDADIGARVGLRWSKGPFELANDLGVGSALEAAKALATRWELPVPKGLAEQAGKSEPFPIRLVDLTVDDGVATVRINRPDALNAINPAVVDQLAARFDEAAGRDDVQGIVLAGAGKAFVAGADIKFFVDRIDAGAIEDIQAFTKKGADLFARIDDCEKTVVAKLDGLSLGGGSELALCADIIVATERASLGFPETGIGIYPGLGGTQRTTRRVKGGLSRWMVLTGDTVGAKMAYDIGLVDEVVSQAEVDERCHALAKGATLAPRAVRATSNEVRSLETFFRECRVDELLDTGMTMDATFAKKIEKVRRKAPVALALAEDCIARGEKDGEKAGLARELELLPTIFATKDAREGLGALLEGRRPKFTGER